MCSRNAQVDIGSKKHVKTMKVAEQVLSGLPSPKRNIFKSLQNLIEPIQTQTSNVNSNVAIVEITATSPERKDTSQSETNKSKQDKSNQHFESIQHEESSSVYLIQRELNNSIDSIEDSNSIRRSKRKRIPKILNDEPYKRMKGVETDIGVLLSDSEYLKMADSGFSSLSSSAESNVSTVNTNVTSVKESVSNTSSFPKVLIDTCLCPQEAVKEENFPAKTTGNNLLSSFNIKKGAEPPKQIKETLSLSEINEETLNIKSTPPQEVQQPTIVSPLQKETNSIKTQTEAENTELRIRKNDDSIQLQATTDKQLEACGKLDEIGLEVISPRKSDFVKLGPTMACFKCGSIFQTRYAIIFTQRFYCCRECLPAETTREMRLGTVIKQCHQSVASRERRQRTTPKNYRLMESSPEVKCTTPNCDGMGHINGKNLRHRGASSCPNVVKNIVKEEPKEEITNIKSPTSKIILDVDKEKVQIKPKLLSSKIESTLKSPDISPPTTPTFNFVYKGVKRPKGSKKDRWKCPLLECDSQGHTNGKYPTHRSIFGCPLALRLTKENVGSNQCPNPGCDSIGNSDPEKTTHSSLATCPKLAVDHERHCPVPGCDGKGHTKKSGRCTTHRSIKTCPRAAMLNLTEADFSAKSDKKTDDDAANRNEMQPPKMSNEKRTGKIPISYRHGDIMTDHSILYKEVALLKLTNDEIKEEIPELKSQLRSLESEDTFSRERLDDLLIEDYQVKNKLREQRVIIEKAIRLASIPLNFADIPNIDHERFFERLRNYFTDKHTYIYRDKLKSFLNKV